MFCSSFEHFSAYVICNRLILNMTSFSFFFCILELFVNSLLFPNPRLKCFGVDIEERLYTKKLTVYLVNKQGCYLNNEMKENLLKRVFVCSAFCLRACERFLSMFKCFQVSTTVYQLWERFIQDILQQPSPGSKGLTVCNIF